MDGKSKKILNFMKKNGTELEADEIAFPLKMDEDLVKKLLNELKQENLVTERTDEKGRSFFTAAAEQPKADKRAKAKDDEDEDFEPVQKKEKAPRIITENEVLDIDDFSPKAAPPPIAAAPVAAPPPIPTYSEFSPNESPSIAEEVDFSTETSTAVNNEPDIEDFAPKAKKKKEKEPKIKEPKFDEGDDFEPKEKSSSPLPKNVIPIVCVVLLLIIAFFMGVSSGSGKVNKAVSKASEDLVKIADFHPVKENADKISSMEEKINKLEASLKSVESELNTVKQAAAARPAPARAPANRRR